MTNNQLTDERVTSVIDRLEHYACNLKWTNVRGAQDLLAAADGLRELQELRKAALDSEPGCLPLDYLQGQKDGLEWAAQLAEANHHDTGGWLYDDPIELAKAIRKGPDMPPAQPAADSEPVAIIDQANLDYLRSGADADVWPPEREEMGDVLLYRHAQPAPVCVPTFEEWCELTEQKPVGWVRDAMKEAYDACRAAMLNGGKS